MTPFLPALRSGSLLRPFLSDFFADISPVNWQSAPWSGEDVGFRIDLAEYQDRYVLKADLPGVLREEIEITLNNSRLSIQVKPHSAVQDPSDGEVNYIVRERRRSEITRVVLLPFTTSERNIDAAMKDGVLTVTIKKDESLMPKRITVH